MGRQGAEQAGLIPEGAAIAAVRQGARVGYVTAVGRDMAGDSFLSLWSREGVDPSTVLRSERYQTGVHFVTYDTDGHHFLHDRAHSAAAMMTPDDVPEAAIAAALKWTGHGAVAPIPMVDAVRAVLRG